jgi:hypothetical protein
MHPTMALRYIFAALLTCLSIPALSQQAKFGTPAEARAMLDKAVSAVKADKAKALELFNKGAGGFLDRDLQPFCFNLSDGKLVAATNPATLGVDIRTLKDKTGKSFGEENFKAAVDDKVNEVTYMYPRPGETEPSPKVSYITKVGDLGCGVGYFKQ